MTRAPFRVEDAVEHALVRDNLAIANLGVVAYLGQPLMTAEGHVLGALCAIDTRRRAWTADEENALADLAAIASNELALFHFAQELDARVRQETLARLAAQEQLGQRRRLEALGQLAGGVAHDFANVLQAVQGGVRLAAKKLDRDPEAARRLLEAVADAAQRGGSITRRLLGFARRGELRVEEIDLSAVLADLEDILTRTLSWPALRIRIEADAKLAPVRVDRGELETVLVNLATNARDAMPSGGTLTLSARAEVVRDDRSTHGAGLHAGRYVRLAAEDTGVGMDQETLARAAEPFFSTKPKGEGTGLGLAMARDFAAQAGGAFAIDSEPGRGTTVTLWLPAVREAERAG
jgi:signal transduction histidine kinase